MPAEIKRVRAHAFSNTIWLNRAGTALSIAGVVFVGTKFYEYGFKIPTTLGIEDAIVLVLLALLYSCSNLLLSLGWHRILLSLRVRASVFWSISTYAKSQIAKYIPGNVFQFAGRQAVGLAAGVPGRALITSAFWEIGLLASSGATFSILVISLVLPSAQSIFAIPLFIVAAVGLVIVARVAMDASRALAMLNYLIFLVISGSIFFVVLSISGGQLPANRFSEILGAYVVSWLVGLLLPGAPAGLGVREASLFFLLAGTVGHESVIVAAALVRAITLLGDFSFFLIAPSAVRLIRRFVAEPNAGAFETNESRSR